MKTTQIDPNRHSTLRQAALKQIGQIGPFLEGSLCAFKRPGCAKPGWHLTFKKKGRTSTVYVPMELVEEIQAWTQNYRLLKKLIRQVTRHSMGLIRRHVASQRAARPNPRSIRGKSGRKSNG